MPTRAFRAERTPPPIVIWTLDPPVPPVEIEALPTQLAFPNLLKGHADGHRAEVEVVGVLAIVAYLAQVSEVVLAYCCFLFPFARMGRKRRRRSEVGGGGGSVAVGAKGRR